MKTAFALVLGAVIAAVVACGGAKSASKTPGAMPTVATDGGATPRGEIDRLEREIASALQEMNLPPPPPMPMNMGSGMQDTATPLPPSNDPTCKPGETATCKDSCKLSDSICTNAKKICELAASMNDDWATNKCSSGNASCETSRKRCCGCQ